MATEKTSQAPTGVGKQTGSSGAHFGPTTNPHQPPAVDAEKIRAQLRLWQDRVLDLTKSNPLLGLNRSRVAKLEVSGPDAQALFVRLALEEAELKMPLVRKVAKRAPDSAIEADADPQLSIEAGDVEFVASPVELLRRMRRIYDNARTTVEERGLTTLYLTFGTLCWRDELFGDSVSPLWMVPCQLTSRGPDAPLRLSLSDEEMQLNPALEYCLRERHKTSLPELPEEPDEGSLTEFLAGIRRAGELTFQEDPIAHLSSPDAVRSLRSYGLGLSRPILLHLDELDCDPVGPLDHSRPQAGGSLRGTSPLRASGVPRSPSDPTY
jgi:hypothetical protein